MPKRMDALWMLVTNDRYELPVLICDTAQELARKSGYSINTIYSIISRRQGKKQERHFRTVPYTIRRVKL